MQPIQTLLSDAVARLVRPAPLSPAKLAFAWRATVGPAVSRATRVRLVGLLGVLESSSMMIDSGTNWSGRRPWRWLASGRCWVRTPSTVST